MIEETTIDGHQTAQDRPNPPDAHAHKRPLGDLSQDLCGKRPRRDSELEFAERLARFAASLSRLPPPERVPPVPIVKRNPNPVTTCSCRVAAAHGAPRPVIILPPPNASIPLVVPLLDFTNPSSCRQTAPPTARRQDPAAGFGAEFMIYSPVFVGYMEGFMKLYLRDVVSPLEPINNFNDASKVLRKVMKRFFAKHRVVASVTDLKDPCAGFKFNCFYKTQATSEAISIRLSCKAPTPPTMTASFQKYLVGMIQKIAREFISGVCPGHSLPAISISFEFETKRDVSKK